jgi:hypothetical protein
MIFKINFFILLLKLKFEIGENASNLQSFRREPACQRCAFLLSLRSNRFAKQYTSCQFYKKQFFSMALTVNE